MSLVLLVFLTWLACCKIKPEMQKKVYCRKPRGQLPGCNYMRPRTDGK
ncbi:unnamed protein product [Plutella xylostella]|uniref:(diamondback moth) hypothetical protein n=1 Tax=Plutella xylostella TaxID=51655 RepID=A0A8S4FZR3_PLUXY|nr:unnamed protein product [Plutella xylostella]